MSIKLGCKILDNDFVTLMVSVIEISEQFVKYDVWKENHVSSGPSLYTELFFSKLSKVGTRTLAKLLQTPEQAVPTFLTAILDNHSKLWGSILG